MKNCLFCKRHNVCVPFKTKCKCYTGNTCKNFKAAQVTEIAEGIVKVNGYIAIVNDGKQGES